MCARCIGYWQKQWNSDKFNANGWVPEHELTDERSLNDVKSSKEAKESFNEQAFIKASRTIQI
jgi:hypothetical protein